jgi:uncharacterized protein DUF4242
VDGSRLVEPAVRFCQQSSLGGFNPRAGPARAVTPASGARARRSVFAPEDGRCFCLFEAPDAEAVKQVNQAAGLPFRAVVPALDLPRPARRREP